MLDPGFREKYRTMPQQNITFDNGPWLKPTVAATRTSLSLRLLESELLSRDGARLRIRVANTGSAPAVPVRLEIEGVKRAFYATDNFFWLAPGEAREISVEVLWRESDKRGNAVFSVAAWNADAVFVGFGGSEPVPPPT
jgi:beta-mannosidase